MGCEVPSVQSSYTDDHERFTAAVRGVTAALVSIADAVHVVDVLHAARSAAHRRMTVSVTAAR